MVQAVLINVGKLFFYHIFGKSKKLLLLPYPPPPFRKVCRWFVVILADCLLLLLFLPCQAIARESECGSESLFFVLFHAHHVYCIIHHFHMFLFAFFLRFYQKPWSLSGLVCVCVWVCFCHKQHLAIQTQSAVSNEPPPSRDVSSISIVSCSVVARRGSCAKYKACQQVELKSRRVVRSIKTNDLTMAKFSLEILSVKIKP